ncbi:VOC family protein [Stackebrandtia soli]|uniref:VOC family protein n=1 Tax=Stackebrandtia soli TaxID=1892856 RepID=UPI0039E90AD3
MHAKADPLVISLPIADRPRSMEFYRDVFGFEVIGEPAEDGVPEPLQFKLNEGTLLMLIPSGGFGWVLAGREVAAPGVNECLLGLSFSEEREVTELAERIERAGGTVVVEPRQQPWGFTAVCADLDGHAWNIAVTPSA